MGFLIALIIIILVVVISNIKIVPQANAYIVERLGAYYQTWDTNTFYRQNSKEGKFKGAGSRLSAAACYY